MCVDSSSVWDGLRRYMEAMLLPFSWWTWDKPAFVFWDNEECWSSDGFPLLLVCYCASLRILFRQSHFWWCDVIETSRLLISWLFTHPKLYRHWFAFVFVSVFMTHDMALLAGQFKSCLSSSPRCQIFSTRAKYNSRIKRDLPSKLKFE